MPDAIDFYFVKPLLPAYGSEKFSGWRMHLTWRTSRPLITSTSQPGKPFTQFFSRVLTALRFQARKIALAIKSPCATSYVLCGLLRRQWYQQIPTHPSFLCSHDRPAIFTLFWLVPRLSVSTNMKGPNFKNRVGKSSLVPTITDRSCQTSRLWRGGGVSQAEPGTSGRGHLADRTLYL
jgi:hypothetical protein